MVNTLSKLLTSMITDFPTSENNIQPFQILPNESNQLLKFLQISNLSEFITNESYFKLLNVNLDYNNISSINLLFASSWLNTFRVLSLKGNNLSEVIFLINYIGSNF